MLISENLNGFFLNFDKNSPKIYSDSDQVMRVGGESQA